MAVKPRCGRVAVPWLWSHVRVFHLRHVHGATETGPSRFRNSKLETSTRGINISTINYPVIVNYVFRFINTNKYPNYFRGGYLRKFIVVDGNRYNYRRQ